MSGRLPDFIIGGAPRSGTTWLYSLLDRHPQIFMAKPIAPEPKFFLVDEIYEKGLDHYSSLFAGASPGQLAGEKSTNYLESAIAAQRMHQHLPQVKLVFILRDPVTRAYSNYIWSRKNGRETETFEHALDQEQQRERDMPASLRFARPHAYFSRGLYADLLAPYFDLFPREQILCLRYEDLVESQSALVRQLHDFLGVESRPQDAEGLGAINAADTGMPSMPVESRRKLEKAYTEPNRRLAALLGKDFKGWHMGLE